jgi:hypothetical protein
MTGIPTNFVIADRVRQQLLNSDPTSARILNNDANLPFFYLGATGASFGDFMPARPELGAKSPNTPYFQAWLPVLQLIAGTPPNPSLQPPTPATNGLYNDMKQILDTLDKLKKVIEAGKNSPVPDPQNKSDLLSLRGDLNQLSPIVTDLQALLKMLAINRTSVATAIKIRPIAKVRPSSGWQPRDTLRGSRTGDFLEALTRLADDDRLKAYRLGAIVAHCADLCGNPYINSVVGAPYRNHWWRHRFISNYVDTWVHGYYASGGAASVYVPSTGIPAPLYATWPNVCEANLHRKIEMGGISVAPILQSIRNSSPLPSGLLPQFFLDYWKAAYQQVYGPPGQQINDAALNSAYAMTWLVLWLQTSGEVIPCVPEDLIPIPDDCPRPTWVPIDSGTVAISGQVFSPPKPNQDTSPSAAKIVSGIILAILGYANYLFGAVLGGVAEIVGAVVSIADGVTDPDWQELGCYVDWVFVYLYEVGDAIHEMLALTGLSFPYTRQLAHDSLIQAIYGGVVTPPDAALNTVRSVPLNPNYPASQWAATISNWNVAPIEPLEVPAENAYPSFQIPTWPYHFVDGLQASGATLAGQPPPPAPQQVNKPLPAPGETVPVVRDAQVFQAIRGNLNVPQATNKFFGFFGNAVDVSLDLILNASPADFLNWDLDADPGIGYPTWVLPSPGAPRSSSIPE